jgi:hypothetical protein
MVRCTRLRLSSASITTVIFFGVLAGSFGGLMAVTPGVASANSQGPIADYSFDEGTGTTVEDLAGEDDGTVEGPEWTNGKFGGALSFDGEESDCVSIPNSESLQLGEEFTVEAWVKAEGSGESEPIIFKETPYFTSYGIYFGLDEHGHLEGYLGEEFELQKTVDPAKLEKNVWTHVALTFDGAHLRLYVDGALVDTEAAEGAEPSSGQLSIGCAQEFEDGFEGRIDEVRIYERALSAGEVAADMGAPLQTPASGPVAAYSFDEGEGSTVKDLEGEDEGTVEGGAGWRPGRYGHSLRFAGTEGECVTVTEAEDLAFEEEFTLEAWVRPEGSGDGPIIFKEGSGLTEYATGIGIVSGSKPEGLIGEGGGEFEYVRSPTAIEPKVWTNIALTYDGAHMRLYVDGELVATKAQATGPPGATGALAIGCNPNFPSEVFEGRIDEPQLYGRALSAGEVAASMENPLQTPRQGPVADYSFDEGTGTTVEDLAGEDDGTVEGPEWTNGKYGGALSFDGEESDCVSIPNSEALQLGEEFTVEAWVKAEGSGESEPIIFKETPYFTSYGIYFGLDEHGHLEGYLGEEWELQKTVDPAKLEKNVWTHVALTFDGAHLRLYVDGALVDTEAAEGAEPSSGQLSIGCAQEFEDGFEGKIDEVRIYERALSPAEVAGDMAAPLQTPASGPVAAYSFDEGEGSTLEDLSGDANEGMIEDAEWKKGRYGDALEYDGEEGCVTVPDSASLQLTEEFTVEGWVRSEGGGHDDPIVLKESAEGSGEGPYSLYLGLVSTGKVEGFIAEEGEPGYSAIADPTTLPRDVWTHVALTYDGAHMRLYVDGELVATKAAGGPEASTGPLLIGCDGKGGFFHGRIDELRLYDRSLSAGEVGANMEVPIETPRQGPVSAWSFDEDEGTTAEDATGGEHMATLGGVDWAATGKYGAAVELDGEEGECLTVPESEALELSEELTIEAWVKPSSTPNDDPIVYKEGYGFPDYAMGIGISSEGRPEGLIGEGGTESNSVVGPKAIEAHVWTHLAFTYDGAHMRLYVDGELVQTKTMASPPPITPGILAIGCNPLYPSEVFDGRIDEVRVYERALSAQEVSSDAASPIFVDLSSTYAAETEEGGTKSVTAHVEGPSSREPGAPLRLFLSVQEFAPSILLTTSEKKEFCAPTTPQSCYRQKYNFHECSAAGTDLVPDLHSRKIPIADLKAYWRDEQKGCHNFEVNGEEETVPWAISVHGDYFYEKNKREFLKPKEPECTQSEYYQPELKDCEARSRFSTQPIRVYGDWRWQKQKFDPGTAPPEGGARVCARLTGVLPLDPERAKENAGNNFYGTLIGPYVFRWWTIGFATNTPCYFDGPGDHGYDVHSIESYRE